MAATKEEMMSLRDTTKRLKKLQTDVDDLELRLAEKEAELSEFRAKRAHHYSLRDPLDCAADDEARALKRQNVVSYKLTNTGANTHG